MEQIILRALVIVSIPFSMLSIVFAEDNAKEWGGLYMKFSAGYGKPDLVTKNCSYSTDWMNTFSRLFSATAREIAYDYRIGNNIAIGAEAGLTWLVSSSDTKYDVFLVKGEFVPQVSYVNGPLKLFTGVGLGFANGYGLKGLPNVLTANVEKGYHTAYNEFGGYWLAEVGVDYLLTPVWFIGAKYQYERTLSTFKNLAADQSLYVQQHTFLLSIGFKYN